MNDRRPPELWCVDLAAAAPALHLLEARTPRLSPLDASRAAAFADATVRDEWLAAHIALRLLIERVAGPRWRRVSFARGERGKPHLDGAPAAFSLSHTRGLALVGIAPGGNIGVDIERARPVRVGEARRARIIEAAAALCAAPLPDDGEARFLQAWVRLEAYAKAEGSGIGRVLTRLGILGADAATRAQQPGAGDMAARLRVEPGSSILVRDKAIADGVFTAVALAGFAEPSEANWLPVSVAALEELAN